MRMNKKTLLIAMATAMPWLSAHAQSNAELLQQIQALQAQLQALQAKVEQVSQNAANDSQAVTRIQQQLDVADDNALLTGMKGLSIKAVIDPTFISTQRARESDFVLMRDNDRFSFFDSAYIGTPMIEFGKETEDGTQWKLRLTPKSAAGLVHEASVSVPLDPNGKTRLNGGLIPDFSGYESSFGHENPLVTHNLLFDFSAASNYTGAGMSYEIGKMTTKWVVGNIDGKRGKAPGFAYRADWELSEFAGVGFSGVHGKDGRENGNNRFDLIEVDGFHERGDWLYRAQGTIGRYKNGGSNGDARWWGLSGLAGYKITPRLQALVRLDYLNNSKNGGGIYGASLADNGTGTYLDSVNGFGPSIDNSTGMAIDPSRGSNRYALSTGLNYLINDNTSVKFEVRFDRSSGNVFLDSKSGLYKKSNVLFGGALVFHF
ncbi:DUF3138 family protein [Hydrogenophaga sp. OTU3427]|uniref:DUF3138 family protein n=1 Tax=Hydrogenophaga sp. OTU3427 TaxID=3043856 RepID=UPI00313A798B